MYDYAISVVVRVSLQQTQTV